MKSDQHFQEEHFADALIALDEQLKRGDSVPIRESNDAIEKFIDERLSQNLSVLKKLDTLRKRSTSSTITHVPLNDLAEYSQTQFRLPCRFGKFELLRELGRGGFGMVYLAKDTVLECEVAVKIPHSHVLTNDELRQRFVGEAKVAAGLQHNNIVSVREAGLVGPINYIVYDYCPGITMSEWLKKLKEQVPSKLAAEWLIRLGEAIAYAHSKGVMHRDLKPSNILLVAAPSISNPDVIINSNAYTPKITDFGLAKLEKEKHRTSTGALVGTPAYMSPEQASGVKKLTPSVDIHGLGVLLYEMLSGHPPFRGETDLETLHMVSHDEPLSLRKLRPRLSGDLETICMKCLQKEPHLRYRNGYDLVADLVHFLNHEPIKARPVSPIERFFRKCRKHPLVSALVAALFLAVSGGMVGILWQSHQRSLQAETIREQANATRNWLNKYLTFLRSEVASATEMMKDIRTEKQGREKLVGLLSNYESLINDPQSDTGLQIEAAKLAVQAGHIHLTLLEYLKAIVRYQQSIDIFDQVLKTHGSNPDLLLEQARSQSRLGFCYRALGKWEVSEAFYRKAIEQGKQLLNADPENTEVLALISTALVYNSFNLNLTRLNRFEEMGNDLKEAMLHIQKANAIQPDSEKLQIQWALALDDYGLYCKQAHLNKEADANLTKAMKIRVSLSSKAPSVLEYQETLARSYNHFGVFHRDNGDFDKAIEFFKKTYELYDRLIAKYPGRPFLVAVTINARQSMAELLESRNNLEAAEKLLVESIEIRQNCQTLFPQLEINRDELSKDYFRLASMLRKHAKKQEAYKHFQDGLTIREKLASDFPDHILYKEAYLDSLKLVAQFYQEDHMPRELEAINQRIDFVRRQLNSKDSSSR